MTEAFANAFAAAGRSSFMQRLSQAITDAQMRRVQRELMIHAPFINDTALINGELRRLGLSDSDRLPFNR